MEYVIVTFPTERQVFIDGEQDGYTNEVLRVDAGSHLFELGHLENYRPGSRKVLVQDTTPSQPLEIAFYRKDD
jgi:hypothetical protein